MDASEHARALSALGASKGGIARAESLSDDEKRAIAKKAAKARWGGVATAKAAYEGTLKIAGQEIACAVLEDGRRVLTQQTFLAAIGRAPKAKAGTGSKQMLDKEGVDNLPPFLSAENLKDFISKELRESTTPVVYRTSGGGRAFGYEAKLLPMVCNVYLKARDEEKLSKGQKHIATACDILIRGLAEVGIIALIDEATGYQYDRERKALTEILEKFISKELTKWVKTFPDDFYAELFRLKNCPRSTLTSKRPQWVGKVTLNLIYQRLAPGVREELERLTPRDSKGRLKHKLFQRLTEDIGHPKLKEHFIKLLTLMQATRNWDEFYPLVQRALPKYKPMPLFDSVDTADFEIDSGGVSLLDLDDV